MQVSKKNENGTKVECNQQGQLIKLMQPNKRIIKQVTIN